MGKKVFLLLAAALLVGFGVGYLVFHSRGTEAAPAAAAGGGTTLYTCGMHPEVIQDHPGTCPQCGMKLTPLEADAPTDQGGNSERKILYWVAPMDPSYVRDKPGKSPMGMDLVPVYEDDVTGGPTVRINPTTEQNMGVRTAVVVRGPLVREVRAVGNVEYDETIMGVVALKVAGYVEKLFVDETGATVHKGDPLFSMYAPDVVQAQDEYLRTKVNLDGAEEPERQRWKDLFDQARMKLLRWDVSEQQIRELEARGTPRKNMIWNSPFDGIVLHKNAVEGAYFKPGDPLYQIAGLDTVWVLASIYEFEFPWVKEGQKAIMRLPYYPGQVFEGVVDHIYPYLDPRTRDRKVRLVFANPGRELVADMYATVTIQARLADEAVLVPGEAVLDTGTRQVVFVTEANGHFDPREVTLGVHAQGGRREVMKGLAPGERVVTSGQFLIDSESRIKEAIQKMMERREKDAPVPPGTVEPTPPAEAAAAFTAPSGLVPVVGEVCPVMGGKPVPDVFVDYQGYRIFFCCTGCPDRFLGDPGKYMEKLRRMGALPGGAKPPAPDPRFQAPAGLIPIVPKACPVLGGEPVPDVYVDFKGYRFFFCCAGCPEEFLKDPKPYIEKLRAEGFEIHIHD